MKIPDKIKIGGYNIKIVKQKDRVKDVGSDSFGCFASQFNTIHIDTRVCQEQQESTLIHEILECINFQHELGLEHKQIVALETSIWDVFTNNNLLK